MNHSSMSPDTAAPAAPVDASDWSHRAPLERWYEDFSADFEEAE